MSRSEDYLDQLLKGVAPEDIKEEKTGDENPEESIFEDIFEELSDGHEMKEEAFEQEAAARLHLVPFHRCC